MSTEEREGKARNEEIENQLKKDRMMQRNEIKMLLLGTSPAISSNNVLSMSGSNTVATARQLPESRDFAHIALFARDFNASVSRVKHISAITGCKLRLGCDADIDKYFSPSR